MHNFYIITDFENYMKNQPKKDIRKSNQVQNKLNYSEKHDKATEKVNKILKENGELGDFEVKDE